MYVNSLNFKLTDKDTTKILNKQVKRHFCFFFINFVPLNALLIKKNVFFCQNVAGVKKMLYLCPRKTRFCRKTSTHTFKYVRKKPKIR